MERLDRRICEQILACLAEELRSRVRLVTSEDLTPQQMTPFLRGLDFLVTSRYHASVLSLGAGVPQLAIGHDERIESIYREAGIDREYLLSYEAPDLGVSLRAAFDRLQMHGAEVRNRLLAKNREYFLPRCAQNRVALASWLRARVTGESAGPVLAESLQRSVHPDC
jgi:polysaccharide pyruvyl transferase WcaK-like protein